MILLPAIDLYEGKVVRLTRGDYSRMTVYREDPLDQAREFEIAGAAWLHTVDLEGARDGTTPNFRVVAELCRSTGLQVEVGGGIRTLEAVARYLDAGAARVILGTAAVIKIFQKQTLKNTTLVDYDKDKLQTQIDALDCMDADKQTAPENASVSSYDKTEGFTVVGCVMGTTIDAEKMYQAVQEAVEGLKENLSLEKAGVYEDPTVLDDDENLVKAVKKMNGYAKTKITFTVGDSKEVLDASVFGDWFRLNKKLKPVLDQECVKAYVSDLAKKYNTCYSAKTLKTSYGKTVTIPESHYGWKIDTEKEIAQITSEIKAGKAVERELNYSMTANSHGKNDYGDSYVEINLTAQHMFLYKDGKLVIDSDFVSGNVSKNNATPTGAYGVTYTEKNATLRGENYETPVTYWMPFAGNVGMHDAYWRSKFGGSIYKYAGSHGCINLPPEVAKVVFENVKKNYPATYEYFEKSKSSAFSGR